MKVKPGFLLSVRSAGAKPLRCASFLAPHLFWFYEQVARFLGERMNCAVELVQGTGYDQLGSDIDLAFLCSLPYVVWDHAFEPLAAPVLAGARYGGEPVYFSDVIVRQDSDIRTFADLRGRSWAYNEPLSQSGYGITRYHLARLGETRGFFGRVVEAGYHERALRLVATGEVDGAAIDSHVLETYLHEQPELAGSVRIIDSLGPSPVQPVAVARRLSAALKAAVRELLTTALPHDARIQPLLARARVSRFVAVDDGTYDPIRMMTSLAAEMNLLVLR